MVKSFETNPVKKTIQTDNSQKPRWGILFSTFLTNPLAKRFCLYYTV